MNPDEWKVKKTCEREGCGKPATAEHWNLIRDERLTLCSGHWAQWALGVVAYVGVLS